MRWWKKEIEWLAHRLFAPKRPSPFREIWRRNFSLDTASVSVKSLRSTSSGGRSLTRKKERKKSEVWKPVKDKYNSNHFPSTILKYWKVLCIQRKRDCKGSISPIIKFIEWKLLQASIRQLRHFYSSKREGKKEKRERDCWETFLFDVFLLA